jgi:hypothetical protein
MITEKPYINVDDTIANIYYLIDKHKDDPILDNFKNYTMQQLHGFISKEIKYIKDPQGVSWLNGDNIELLRSPRQTLYTMSGDCDCKTILAGSIFDRNKVPYRLAIVSERDDKKFHHIYPEYLSGYKYIPFDATYPENELGREKPYTAKRVYFKLLDKIIKKDL